jgi:hypothetical protein
MMMRNNMINILLILISLSISALADDVYYRASDDSAKYIHVASADVEMLLYGHPYTDSFEDTTNAKEREVIDAVIPDDVSIYDPRQAVSINYEGSYAESDLMDVLMIEGFINSMDLPGSNAIDISDYKGLIGKMSGLSPERISREKLAKALRIMAEKGSKPENYRRTLAFVDQEIRNNVDSSAEAIERTSLTSKDQLKQQSKFMNRIRLKTELSVIPALLLAIG